MTTKLEKKRQAFLTAQDKLAAAATKADECWLALELAYDDLFRTMPAGRAGYERLGDPHHAELCRYLDALERYCNRYRDRQLSPADMLKASLAMTEIIALHDKEISAES